MSWAKVARRLGPLWLVAALTIVVPLLTGMVLVVKLGAVAEVLNQQPTLGFVLWTAGAAVLIGVGVMPVYANSIFCGWVFGLWPGAPGALISYGVAAVIGHRLARRVSYERVEPLIASDARARAVREALLEASAGRTLLLVALLRLSGFPFPTANLLLGSCGVPIASYAAGTVLGIGPRVLASTFIAHTAASTGARDVQALLHSQPPLLLAAGVASGALAIGLVGYIGRQALRRAARR